MNISPILKTYLSSNKSFILFILTSGIIANDDFRIESIELIKTEKMHLDSWRISVPESSEDIEETLGKILRILILQSVDEIISVEQRSNFECLTIEALKKICFKIMKNLFENIYIVKKVEKEYSEEAYQQFLSEHRYFVQWTENIYFLKGIIGKCDVNLIYENFKSVKYKVGNVCFSNYSCAELIYDCIPPELQSQILTAYKNYPHEISSEDLKHIRHDVRLEKKNFKNITCQIKDFDSFKEKIKSEEKKLENNILKLKINVEMWNRFGLVNFVIDPKSRSSINRLQYMNLQRGKLTRNYYDGLDKFKRMITCFLSVLNFNEKVWIVVNLDQSLYYRSIIKKGLKNYTRKYGAQENVKKFIINQISRINSEINHIYLYDCRKIVDESDTVLKMVLSINNTDLGSKKNDSQNGKTSVESNQDNWKSVNITTNQDIRIDSGSQITINTGSVFLPCAIL